MTPCIAEQRRTHQALTARLGADPIVVAVDVIPSGEDPSNAFTTDVIL